VKTAGFLVTKWGACVPVKMRNYTSEPLFTSDYLKVRGFLRDLNRDDLVYPGFTWSRWEWTVTHSSLDRSALHKIGVWEENNQIVGLATYEAYLGDAYLFTAQGYKSLNHDMLEYAKGALANEKGVRVLIDNNDRELQRAAVKSGLTASKDQENTAMIDITDGLTYCLPEGYKFTSMADGWDYGKYNTVMWRGFNHKGPPPCTDEDIRVRREMLSSPTILPDIVLAVMAPDGHYVSHCGMWYAPGDKFALVEPVATDPDYRMMGLGRAAVLEAVKRCGRMGAEVALVGSSQQFYYNIGFYPLHTGTWWTSAARAE
jgi:GNAT superfamily N-acetyltransferase